MTDRKQKFVIWAPAYTERSGGVFILHYLCHFLNLNGYQATLWHSGKLMKGGNSWSRIVIYYLKGLKRIIKGVNRTSPSLNTPLATHADLSDAIVIYPETISGNPLRATKVVRWFLHKDGHFNSRIDYGENELHFYYKSVYSNSLVSGSKVSEFRIFVSLDVFKQANYGPREGTCFILRKGRKRPTYHDISNGVVVDEMSHKEMAKVFNESEYCISYDIYTGYSRYAAACGCKSIVVPEPGLSMEDWKHEEELRYGIAYGEEDLERAINTRPKMLDFMKHDQQMNHVNVQKFATDCISFFNT